jgi:hypothetical protein
MAVQINQLHHFAYPRFRKYHLAQLNDVANKQHMSLFLPMKLDQPAIEPERLAARRYRVISNGVDLEIRFVPSSHTEPITSYLEKPCHRLCRTRARRATLPLLRP